MINGLSGRLVGMRSAEHLAEAVVSVLDEDEWRRNAGPHGRADLPLELLRELLPGKNRALNRGLEALEGGLVVVTDDDAVPSSLFLTAWAKYLEHKPSYGVFGGSIVPLFDAAPPRWLIKNRARFAMMFAERDLPEGPVKADAIFGPNMAVRKSMFEAGFRFDETVGRQRARRLLPNGKRDRVLLARGSNRGSLLVRQRTSRLTYCFSRTDDLGRMGEAPIAPGGDARAHMRKRGIIKAPSVPSLWHRLSMFSPFAKRHVESRCAYHLWRGIDDEYAHRIGRQ